MEDEIAKLVLEIIARGHPSRREQFKLSTGQTIRVNALEWHEILVASGLSDAVFTDCIARLRSANLIEAALHPAGLFPRLTGKKERYFFWPSASGKKALFDERQSNATAHVFIELEPVEKYLGELKFRMLPEGRPLVSLLQKQCDGAVEVACNIALISTALSVRDAGHNILKLVKFLPHVTLIAEKLNEWRDDALLTETAWKSLSSAFFGIAIVNEQHHRWLAIVLDNGIGADVIMPAESFYG